MKDETLLKIRKLAKQDEIDGQYKRSIGGAEVAIATPYYTKGSQRNVRRADVLLATFTEEELNDFRTILAIGRDYRYTFGPDKDRKVKRRGMDDLAAWRSYLGMNTLTREESLKELKRMTTYKILDYINAYFEVKPMSKIRRNFINIIKRAQ